MNRRQQEELVATILSKTPEELGLNYTLWNSKVVNEYISSNYSLNYNRRSIRKIMTKLGFSAQKPIKLAYQRDPKKIELWLNDIYPKIKTKAMQEGARIYWGDEMGLQSSDNRGLTYGLKGNTSIIKKTGSRFKCNMLAAISPQGFMNWMVFEDNFTSSKFISFLRRLVRQIKQKVFLILDNHRVHHSKKVKAYVEKYKDKIELFYLPPYCPDMNPQELVNQDVKANSGNFKPVKSMSDLTTNLRYYLTKIQFNEYKIRNFFAKPELIYAADPTFNF
jgi:transposase